MVTWTLLNAKQLPFPTQVNGEFEMGDIVHNLIAGIEFIETSNDNDRYNADWTPDDNC